MSDARSEVQWLVMSEAKRPLSPLRTSPVRGPAFFLALARISGNRRIMLPRSRSITLLLLGIISLVAQPRLSEGGRLWVPTDDLTDARAYSPAVTLLDGRILVEGGKGRSGNTLASAEIFDPATSTWSATGSLLIARSLH